MHFKLIVAVVEDADTDAIVAAARSAGATGVTVINQARGEGYVSDRGYFGLDVGGGRDVVLLLVEEHLSRPILESVGRAGRFDSTPGAGIAFQLDVEDVIGAVSQERLLQSRIEEEL
jgi:hypothetical protein